MMNELDKKVRVGYCWCIIQIHSKNVNNLCPPVRQNQHQYHRVNKFPSHFSADRVNGCAIPPFYTHQHPKHSTQFSPFMLYMTFLPLTFKNRQL